MTNKKDLIYRMHIFQLKTWHSDFTILLQKLILSLSKKNSRNGNDIDFKTNKFSCHCYFASFFIGRPINVRVQYWISGLEAKCLSRLGYSTGSLKPFKTLALKAQTVYTIAPIMSRRLCTHSSSVATCIIQSTPSICPRWVKLKSRDIAMKITSLSKSNLSI